MSISDLSKMLIFERRQIMRINKAFVFTMILPLIGLLSSSAWAADSVTHQKDPNMAAAFKLPDQNGKDVSLADYQGKMVVLEWTNYDCPFVKAEYKAMVMKNLAEKYAKQGVVWLAINSTNYADVKGNEAFIKENQLPYPVLLDKDGKVGKLYGAKTTPNMFIVDTRGKIVYRGAVDNAPLAKKPENEVYVNYVQKALDELLAGKAVSIPQTKPYGCSVKYAEPVKAKHEAKTTHPNTLRNNMPGGHRRSYY
jgi:peroxiredoxin